ncbi:two-component system histidine kinase PnpS [Bacillus sp. FJAT-52991]|uniref:histidine kinase n=1 Tax=Bacillus kandeliae TaxID=3129297 RepID=A0ABZ2N3K4_9BACI
MIKLRTRLVLWMTFLVFIFLVALGVALSEMFKTYNLQTLNDRLEKESVLLADQISREGGISQITEERVEEWSEQLKVRVAIVDASGNLLVDSDMYDSTKKSEYKKLVQRIAKLEEPENYQEALAIKYNEQFHWQVIQNREGATEGVVVLNTKIDDFPHVYKQIWVILFTSIGAMLLVIVLLGVKITNRYTKPIESATKVAIELAKGNYRARTYDAPTNEVGMLNTSINILARNLQEMMQAQEVHQNRLTTLIENMESGLLLIDDRGFIIVVNKSFKKFFHVKNERLIKKRYYEAIQYKEVIEIIEEVFMTEENVRKQLLLSLGIERKHFEVSGAPIIGTNDEWKGILIVFHDITEIKKLEQMRKDFVANVSHELKTPITSIKGFTETLLDGAMNEPEALSMFLNIILKESERMQTLVMDLLDLSKIEQNGIVLNLKPVRVDEVIEEILLTLENRIHDKRISLMLNIENNLEILGDLYRLKQVFINLINNAILYTQEEGTIQISAFDQGSYVEVQVSDNGIGIEEEEVPRIFERFYRVDKARSRNSGGTGLGLAIVKHILEAHDGKIFVHSKLNEGTTFIVKLKKQPDIEGK